MAEWHWLTCEYPPQPGGVSDYSRLVTQALAHAGEKVHVWCPPAEGATPEMAGVQVHRVCGRFSVSDLGRLGRELDRCAAPRRLFVQWVPHGYGWRSLNLAFCLWLWWRARCRRDPVFIMVHEPFLGFDEGGFLIKAAAAVQRLMTLVLLRAAERVGVSIPAWEACWRPWALGRRIPFAWLPIPCTVPVVADATGVAEVRARLEGGLQPVWAGSPTRTVVGHFGSYGRYITDLLTPFLPVLLAHEPDCIVLLLGRGSDAFREDLAARHPELAPRLQAAGSLDDGALSCQLQACDLLVQPYPDGVSTRRTTAMAALSHGRALVTTAGKLTEPVWAESGAAALVPASDSAALVAAVRRLLKAPAERQMLAAAGLALYAARFDLCHTVSALRQSLAPERQGNLN